MYKLEYYDNQVPQDIHVEAYNYLQTRYWECRLRNVPEPGISPNAIGADLIPYVAKKTIYRINFGSNFRAIHKHAPIGNLFDCINSTMFDNKFELAGKEIGFYPSELYPRSEIDDFHFDCAHVGCTSYMQAQPYETVKRTRAPHRDWDSTPLDNDRYYTITFVANQIWSPVWHAEMFFYNDTNNEVEWDPKFITNMPGRVILHDSRMLHASRPTSVLAQELSQRIGFRVKLKDGRNV